MAVIQIKKWCLRYDKDTKTYQNKIMMCTKMNIECQAWYVKLAVFVPVMN